MDLLGEMGIELPIFTGLLLLFIIEQVMYWATGSSPYRYGLPVQTIPIPGIAISEWETFRQNHENLSIKIDNRQQNVYVRYSYPSGTPGPLLFMGHIIYGSSGTLKVRVGYFSAIFLLFIIFVDPWLSGNGYHGYQLLISLLILVFIGWLYWRFWNGIKKVIH